MAADTALRLARRGLAIVNGCVPPPTGLVSRQITGLPNTPYYAARLPDRADDPALSDLLTALADAIDARRVDG